MKEIAKAMRLTGMQIFMDAVWDCMSERDSILSVIHTAQAAEILLKARIADEHPLLIFKKIPDRKTSHTLSLDMLIEKGQTLSYSELPDRLWASTGLLLDNLEEYYEFGRLRNQIIHTSMATRSDFNFISLKFSLEILDPLVEKFWGKSVIEFIQIHPSRSETLKNLLFDIQIEKDVSFMSKCDKFPKLRPLLGDKALVDWVLFKEEIEKGRIDLLNIIKEFSEEVEEVDDHRYQFYRQHEQYEQEMKYAEWKAFIDAFQLA